VLIVDWFMIVSPTHPFWQSAAITSADGSAIGGDMTVSLTGSTRAPGE